MMHPESPVIDVNKLFSGPTNTPLIKENTMLEISKYSRVPFVVDAVRVTPENMSDVARWCGGHIRLVTEDGPSTTITTSYIKVRVQRPLSARQTKAFPGDWILSSGTEFKVYTPTAFERAFEPYFED